MAQATAKKVRIKPPSSSTAATELEALSQWSTIIPDTVLMQKVEELELQAATVSSTVLAGMMGNPRVAREYQARCLSQTAQTPFSTEPAEPANAL